MCVARADLGDNRLYREFNQEAVCGIENRREGKGGRGVEKAGAPPPPPQGPGRKGTVIFMREISFRDAMSR